MSIDEVECAIYVMWSSTLEEPTVQAAAAAAAQ